LRFDQIRQVILAELAPRMEANLVQHPWEIHHSTGHLLRTLRVSAHAGDLIAVPSPSQTHPASRPTCHLSLVTALTTLPRWSALSTARRHPPTTAVISRSTGFSPCRRR